MAKAGHGASGEWERGEPSVAAPLNSSSKFCEIGDGTGVVIKGANPLSTAQALNREEQRPYIMK